MSSKPVKKVHYTSSTKGSSAHGGTPSSPPITSKPTPTPRRPSFSHQRHPSDSGVGSSSSNSATAAVNSASFYTDADRAQQSQNVHALNEVLSTLKERVKSLESKNRNLEETLIESNREKRELRRERDESFRIIEDLKKEKSRAKDGREAKESDGIRVRGSDTNVKITPEKKERGERIPVTVERNTPPMTRREKERDSEARRKDEEKLRAQHQARGRRTSYRDAPPSPLYRDDERDVNPMSPSSRYRDEDLTSSREKRNSGTPPTTKPHNPFTPLSSMGANAVPGRARRASVSYGTSPSIYTSAPQGYPGMTMGSSYVRRERDEVPYIRGEVPVNVGDGVAGTRGSRLSGGSVGSANDDMYPNDGKYHPYPLNH
ncbi:uncharacterized protein Bfra_009697 [Botrytis fragariae]|uniref:Uncharacterized protein n=1 Tax=Botrytis fragariae TaxID=1964551 RepID=A0A8H6AN05_9HELO|nr:uncharacterized protein Bfra_009697 [Botrytis fragariae]KAF5870313.1 hypothetical protein Bfra_009697 [Botrytis fragariae]